ncbi:hypothetical protein [Streptococcus acidominimus]|nr:hypothetical protein [Streptococcus acidominimus]
MFVAIFGLNIIKPSEAFIADWGAAVSAPFAEEFRSAVSVTNP